MSANVDAMVREAIRETRAGNKAEARALLEKATELDQMNEQAWMWLSAVIEDPDDQRVCLENVLYINPDNKDARRGLDMLTANPSGASTNDDADSLTSANPFHVTDDNGLDEEPPTATSSASATYNPAKEVSVDEYDDWVGGLNLGGNDTPEDDAFEPETFGMADEEGVDDDPFASAFDDVFGSDDEYDDGSDNFFEEEEEEFEDADSDDFLADGPFSSDAFAFSDDDVIQDDSLEFEDVASPAPRPKISSPGEASPIERQDTFSSSGSGALYTEAEGNTGEEPDASIYFRAIPKGIKATRLPGTDEKYPALAIVGLVILILLNLGAAAALFLL